MKRIGLLITGMATCGWLFAATPELPVIPVKDTVVINFGNNSKIMILVDNPSELKKISEFDINTMLKDLSISVDSMEGDEKYLKIVDESGDKYLKDTSIVVTPAGTIDMDALRESIREEVKKELEEEKNATEKPKRKENKRTRQYFNFELGMNNYIQEGKFPDADNELYSIKPWGSWYVGFSGSNRTHITGPLYLDWGGGISWYNFKYQNVRTRLEKGETGVRYYEDLEIPSPIKSKLSVTHLNLNLVPMLNFGKSGRKKDLLHWDYYDSGFRVGLGGYIGYRIKSWSKYTWREDGDKKKFHERDNFYLNNVRYGLRFVMGYRSFDLFVNYDLSELYSEGRGPELHPFSFGIIL
jgi:hypothetical protein